MYIAGNMRCPGRSAEWLQVDRRREKCENGQHSEGGLDHGKDSGGTKKESVVHGKARIE
jgi:hypothetical protein